MKKYPATLTILGICIVVEILSQLNPALRDHLSFYPEFGLVPALRLITYQFAHAGWSHLLGNFAFGLPFMVFLEGRLGRRQLLELYVACGVASALLFTLMVNAPGLIGSSGSIFGVMTAACMAFGESTEEHLAALAYLLVLLIPQIAMAPFGAQMGVAIWGHVGGALAGILLSYRIHRAGDPASAR